MLYLMANEDVTILIRPVCVLVRPRSLQRLWPTVEVESEAAEVTASVGVEVFPINQVSTLTQAVDYENVGGVHLEAALEHMNPYGRIVMCGMIDIYNATAPVPGPPNLAYLIGKKLTMQGFIVSDHFDILNQFYADLGKWIAEGQIKWKETVVEGLENAPRAFIGLFNGGNFGKMVVKVGE